MIKRFWQYLMYQRFIYRIDRGMPAYCFYKGRAMASSGIFTAPLGERIPAIRTKDGIKIWDGEKYKLMEDQS